MSIFVQDIAFSGLLLSLGLVYYLGESPGNRSEPRFHGGSLHLKIRSVMCVGAEEN